MAKPVDFETSSYDNQLMEVQPTDDGVLADQRAFYRARAPEYDEWWQRRGRYDLGLDDTLEWNRQVRLVAEALDRFEPLGDVLELAGGTGWWSERLAQTADTLTVVDSCDETLAINRQRLNRAEVTYLVADLFTWQRNCQYLWIGVFQATSVSVDSAGSGGVMSAGRSSSLPLWKTAPARTRATRWGALTARHRACAASISL